MHGIRIGLVGLGGRGLSWLRLVHAVPGFRVTALCDPIAALHEAALAALTQRVPWPLLCLGYAKLAVAECSRLWCISAGGQSEAWRIKWCSKVWIRGWRGGAWAGWMQALA